MPINNKCLFSNARTNFTILCKECYERIYRRLRTERLKSETRETLKRQADQEIDDSSFNRLYDRVSCVGVCVNLLKCMFSSSKSSPSWLRTNRRKETKKEGKKCKQLFTSGRIFGGERNLFWVAFNVAIQQ